MLVVSWCMVPFHNALQGTSVAQPSVSCSTQTDNSCSEDLEIVRLKAENEMLQPQNDMLQAALVYQKAQNRKRHQQM